MTLRPQVCSAEGLVLQRELNCHPVDDVGVATKRGSSSYSCRAQVALSLLLTNQALNPPNKQSHPTRRDRILQSSNPTFHSSCKRTSPDHHLHGVHTDAQAPVLGDDVGNPATAVADLRVKVNPLSGRRLGHDVNVHLGRQQGWVNNSIKDTAEKNRPSTGTSHPRPLDGSRAGCCFHPLHFTDLS